MILMGHGTIGLLVRVVFIAAFVALGSGLCLIVLSSFNIFLGKFILQIFHAELVGVF